MTASGTTRHALWRVLAFLGVVTLFFYALIAATMPKYTTPSTPDEIAQADLSSEFICLDSSIAQIFPGTLYSSEDFANGDPQPGDAAAKFQTERIVLSLEPGVTYGITGQTATYAQRVYVNGELLNETGTVSDSPSTFEPRTDLYAVYFTPESSQTEIIVQHAWFNHVHGALHKVYLAQQNVIEQTTRAQTLCDGLIAGALLAIGLFFLGMFLFSPIKREMLWFSLSCAAAALNYLIYESKQIMVFFPNLNWYVGHKIELITNIWYFAFIALFAFALLNIRPSKRTGTLLLSAAGALTLFYIVAPSTLYSRLTTPLGAAMLVGCLCTSLILLRSTAKAGLLHQPDLLFVSLSPLLVTGVYIVEGITYFSHVFYLRAYLMILLAFCNALALAMGHAKTEHSLSEARRRELAKAEENALLEKLNELKGDFMRNLAHEMKTPLTVMSGYAQLTERQIQHDSVDADTLENLETVAREAGRLSDMVTQLMATTYHTQGALDVAPFQPSELLHDASSICRPILLKNGNTLETSCHTERMISISKEALLQVITNLCINSNKHTSAGTISIDVGENAEHTMAVFTVADNGCGISPDDVPHIFDRGFSKDGSTGLGLTICRDIIESAGGEIAVVETPASAPGTTIRFTVPAVERSDDEHDSAC